MKKANNEPTMKEFWEKINELSGSATVITYIENQVLAHLMAVLSSSPEDLLQERDKMLPWVQMLQDFNAADSVVEEFEEQLKSVVKGMA